MASDLATMLLSGNAAGVAMDPAMAQIAPDIQLGQALTQQGLSTAPAYPMQALGRLAQTLAGGKILNDATGQLQGIYGNAATAAAHTLEQIDPNHPLLAGLRSPDPYSRMISLQQFPKAMLLASDTKALKTGEELRHAAPGPAVAANTGDAAAAAEAAKNPALVARAGDIKRAEAPFEGGGNVVVPGLGGPVTIPATAATRAAIQPGGPQGVPAPVTPRPPADDVVVGPGPLAGMHVPGTANAAAAAPATAPPGPNFNQRFAGVTGQPVETPEFQGEVAGQKALHSKADEALGAAIGERIAGGSKATYDKLNALDTMESALRSGGQNVITGPFAESILKGRETLAGMGINTDWLNKGLPQTEIISKMNAQLASASAKAMTGRPTQAEFQIWMRNNPGLVTSPQGTLALINVLRQQSTQDIELSKLAMDKKNWNNWPQVEADYFQKHGLTNPLTGQPMRAEIAAAHGAPQGMNAPAEAAPKVGDKKQFKQGVGVWNGTTYVPEAQYGR